MFSDESNDRYLVLFVSLVFFTTKKMKDASLTCVYDS